MAKKKSRAHQVSKGERKSTARKTTLAIKNSSFFGMEDGKPNKKLV